MPRLNTYRIRHVVNATGCTDQKARTVFAQLFPEKNVKNSKRGLTHDEYKLMCECVREKDVLVREMLKKKPFPKDEAKATKEKTKDKPKKKEAEPEKKEEATAKAGISPEAEKTRIVTAEHKPTEQPPDADDDERPNNHRQNEVLHQEVVDNQRKVCDTVLKPLVYELSTELNRGATEEVIQNAKRGVWKHLYDMLANKYGINLRNIEQYQQVTNDYTPRKLHIAVNIRCVHILVEMARNWLADIKRKHGSETYRPFSSKKV